MGQVKVGGFKPTWSILSNVELGPLLGLQKISDAHKVMFAISHYFFIYVDSHMSEFEQDGPLYFLFLLRIPIYRDFHKWWEPPKMVGL